MGVNDRAHVRPSLIDAQMHPNSLDGGRRPCDHLLPSRLTLDEIVRA